MLYSLSQTVSVRGALRKLTWWRAGVPAEALAPIVRFRIPTPKETDMRPLDAMFSIASLILFRIGGVYWDEARGGGSGNTPPAGARPLRFLPPAGNAADRVPVVDGAGRLTGFLRAKDVRTAAGKGLPRGQIVAHDLAVPAGCTNHVPSSSACDGTRLARHSTHLYLA